MLFLEFSLQGLRSRFVYVSYVSPCCCVFRHQLWIEVALQEQKNSNIFACNMEAADEQRPAGSIAGSQHGSAAGVDPPANALAGMPPADLAAITAAAVAAGESPATRRRARSSQPSVDTARRTSAGSPDLNVGGRSLSRSPHPVTPTQLFERPVDALPPRRLTPPADTEQAASPN